ncbi:valine--tRNA ligase [Metallosphaera tengchongensis]|uniref:Valine--tRNA ligase n=1 Tax=Metallosphaera tengchongensis TaxID=1532350 RepID=A0A6N0NVM0_9CREN|nr:valine--tRNA ligase [Metallosphaera tengchongensis]
MEEWPKHYNPKEIEPKWQTIWLTPQFWEKVLKFDENSEKPIFFIDTPPPFTSGELHMGHAYWVAIADAMTRFKRIQGYNVLIPQGWDTQGLPTELKVQYKLGIPKENRDLFLKKCVEWTEEMIGKMKSAMIRLGYRPNWEQFEYRTYNPEYRKVIQKSLLDMHEKGLVKMKKGPVYWCPKCETAVAQSEVGYIERQGILAYISFPLKEGGEIVIATTRPELLGATQAVAVNPQDERYKSLIGKKVIIPIFNKEVEIIADNAVEKEFGTGAVMISTYGDPQDIRWQLKYNLPVTELLDERGRIKGTGLLDGTKVEDARKKMVEILKERGYLKKVETLKHNVLSHTERSDCLSPIEFLVKEQVYIDVVEYKGKLLEESKKMVFKPQRMGEKLEDWIKSVEWDWNISRQRLYGTPLPFWYCDNSHLVPAKEDSLPVDPTKTAPPSERCPQCGLQLKPVTHVADVWIDSSVTVLYLSGFYGNKARFTKAFPADVRLQGTDIIRTWLFYTLFRTLMLAGDVPFKKVVIHGQVLGPDGTRMSKSKGNVVSPMDKIDEFGADAIRMTLLDASLGDDFPFKWETVKGKKLLLQKLWNASRLAYPFIAKRNLAKPNSLNVVDQWILAKHKEFVDRSISAYENQDFFIVLSMLYSYFWETVADEYLELIKHRLFADDLSAIYTLSRILRDIIIILHPIAPHITEEIYSRLFGEKETVLMERLPSTDDIEVNENAVRVGETVKKFNSLVRTGKVNMKLPMNASIRVKLSAPEKFLDDIRIVEEDIKKTLKITEITFNKGEEPSVEIIPG